ncbi:MAG: glycosyl hydrolase family 28 protein [Bacillota bacterium]
MPHVKGIKGPGMHHLEEVILRIPSGKTIYIAGGAAVAGSMVCDSVSDVTVRGRGVLYLTEFGRFSAFRGVRIIFSKRIRVEGITAIDPPHYSIYIGKSEQIRIANFKAFSTKGWSDGIDMMASSDIDIEDVFMRNSDDCIAVYASRWDYQGDTRNIAVRNSVLWADVAHPMNTGGHGNHHRGDVIENVLFENIDVLEHHEPQPDYRGCMSINCGDNNTVRNVTYRNIRVEPFELGQLFDIRVLFNPKYNPVPGKRIENIRFENITCDGGCGNPSRIGGYDADRTARHIVFKNVTINGKRVTDAKSGNIRVLPFTDNVSFE